MTEVEFYKHFGKKCKELRERKGISPGKMIKQTGLSRSGLYEFETRGKKISAYRLNKVLAVLDLPTIDVNFDSKKKPHPFMLEGDELETMDNGEKKDFLEKVKTFVRLFFSEEIMMEVAQEFQDEHDQLRRDAAEKKERQSSQGNEQLNHS